MREGLNISPGTMMVGVHDTHEPGTWREREAMEVVTGQKEEGRPRRTQPVAISIPYNPSEQRGEVEELWQLTRSTLGIPEKRQIEIRC
jgi:hypothetical protein